MMRFAWRATSGSCVTMMIVRPAALSVAEERHEFGRGLRVEVAGRFVGEQHRGIVDECAGDRDALLLAAGEFVGPVRRAVGEADFAESLRRRREAFALRDAGVEEGERDVAQCRGARQQVEALEDEAEFCQADASQRVVVERANVDALEPVRAGRWGDRGSRAGS